MSSLILMYPSEIGRYHMYYAFSTEGLHFSRVHGDYNFVTLSSLRGSLDFYMDSMLLKDVTNLYFSGQQTFKEAAFQEHYNLNE